MDLGLFTVPPFIRLNCDIFFSEKLAQDPKVGSVPDNNSEMLIYFNPAVFLPGTEPGEQVGERGHEIQGPDASSQLREHEPQDDVLPYRGSLKQKETRFFSHTRHPNYNCLSLPASTFPLLQIYSSSISQEKRAGFKEATKQAKTNYINLRPKPLYQSWTRQTAEKIGVPNTGKGVRDIFFHCWESHKAYKVTAIT